MIKFCEFILQSSFSQTMVHGQPVVLEVCPYGPLKKTEEEIKLKLTAYHTIAQNPRVWKWHMAIAFHFFSQYWHFMKFVTLNIYQLPTLLSSSRERYKALWTWFFPCTSGTALVTQPETTRSHNRRPKHQTFSCIHDILNRFADTESAHWNGHVLYLVHQ